MLVFWTKGYLIEVRSIVSIIQKYNVLDELWCKLTSPKTTQCPLQQLHILSSSLHFHKQTLFRLFHFRGLCYPAIIHAFIPSWYLSLFVSFLCYMIIINAIIKFVCCRLLFTETTELECSNRPLPLSHLNKSLEFLTILLVGRSVRPGFPEDSMVDVTPSALDKQYKWVRRLNGNKGGELYILALSRPWTERARDLETALAGAQKLEKAQSSRTTV